MKNEFRKMIPDIFPLTGGVDMVTPPLMLDPGKAIAAFNFEPDINGGYRRMFGIERYDGRARPSDAVYYQVVCVVTGALAVGNTITGATSGATAYVVAIESSTSIIVTQLTGTFVAETFNVSAVAFGTISAVNLNGASSRALHATYKNAAADVYRALIGAVPGSGPVRGVKYYNGNLYAFRDNIGATACVMYQATAGGWTQVTFGKEMQFVTRTATVSVASGVAANVSWTGHKLLNNFPITFAAPNPPLQPEIVAGTVYYVIVVDANTFKLATTPGGGAITTTGSVSYSYTCTCQGITITEGMTIVGATSGATGVVTRSLLRTGTWTVNAVGSLVFDTITGTFQNNECLQVAGTTAFTSTSSSTAIALLPGGRFEFDIVNFYGSASSHRMYCADGVNLAGEFDGTRWVPIRTGVTPDTPAYIVGHKNQLLVAIESEIINSGIGYPYSFTPLTGAGQIATGETITGMKVQVGNQNTGVLVVLTARKVYILYGNSIADFSLVTHSPDSGGRPHTIQNIGFAHFLDTKGVTQLTATQAFGSFQMHVLTNIVQPFIDKKAGMEIASCIVRNKNLYRIFFNDGTGLNIQMRPNVYPGTPPVLGDIIPFDYGARVMNTVDSVVDVNGIERKFGACTDGYVYEIDVGTSFDGDAIDAYLLMAFHHSQSPFVRKSYRRSKLRFGAGATAHLKVAYDLSFGNRDSAYGEGASTVIGGGLSYWGFGQWGTAFWDSTYSQEVTIDTPGDGTSISLLISNESDLDESFVINSIQTQYMIGRLNR